MATQSNTCPPYFSDVLNRYYTPRELYLILNTFATGGSVEGFACIDLIEDGADVLELVREDIKMYSEVDVASAAYCATLLKELQALSHL
jgi:hypothetical protein